MQKFHTVLFSILILSITPAAAESPFKGGMNYTAIRKSEPKSDSSIKQKDMGASEEVTKEPEEDTPSSRVWKKYKSLAAGKSETKPKEEPAKKEKDPAEQGKEVAENVSQESVPQTGLAAIIDKYHKNKERQSKLQTIQVKKPEKPKAPEKPDVEKTDSDD